MSEELKPCPFCGNEPAPYWKGVGCVTSGCLLNGLHLDADKWNRRAQPAEAEGSVEMGSDAWMALHLLDRLDVSADEEPRVQQVEEIVRRMGAALSAVTAERDRLREEAELHDRIMSESCAKALAERDQLRAEVERLRNELAGKPLVC